jgi:1,4-alpha-glucan branching enzyme
MQFMFGVYRKMILNKKRLSFLLLTVVILTFTEIAHTRNTEVQNYENLQSLRKSSTPKAVSMVTIRYLGTGSPFIHEGILFTYENRHARNVQIAGNFSSWKPIQMKRSKHGVWYYFKKADDDHEIYAYKYLVDGTWSIDPQNRSRKYSQVGSFISTVLAPEVRFSTQVTYRILNRNTVEFRIYKPNARFISLVGDFNNWNPEHDLMRKGSDGIWRLTKSLPSGRTYSYNFFIDGEWEVDLYNPNSGSNQLGILCSILVLP